MGEYQRESAGTVVLCRPWSWPPRLHKCLCLWQTDTPQRLWLRAMSTRAKVSCDTVERDILLLFLFCWVQKRATGIITSLCFCNQWAYAGNCADSLLFFCQAFERFTVPPSMNDALYMLGHCVSYSLIWPNILFATAVLSGMHKEIIEKQWGHGQEVPTPSPNLI